MQVKQTVEFKKWIDGLRDQKAVRKIRVRIVRLESGNFGLAKFFGDIGELKIDYGPGYRVYFAQRGDELILLLCGGDKRSQTADIANARALLKEI
jgi:putative addiction module killer protein